MANGLLSESLDVDINANLGKSLPSTSVPSATSVAKTELATNGDIASDTSKIEVTNEVPASEEIALESMTGLAVPTEPITESAKSVEEPTSLEEPSSGTNGHAVADSSDGAVRDSQSGLAGSIMEHAVSVDAPVSDLRPEVKPAENPARSGDDRADQDPPIEVSGTAGTPQPAMKHPQSPVSPPAERTDGDIADHRSQSVLKVGPTTGPTPPQSSAAASPRPDDAVVSTNDSPMTNAESVPASGAKHERTEEPSEPSAKRARIDGGSVTPNAGGVTFAEPDPQRLMTPNRQKYCLSVLRQLKRSKDAPPFMQPVDPVKLKIPDYLKIVTSPQDLGTIESKLKKNEYHTIDDFIDSVDLVWSNCQRYNGPESPINLMALRLKELFERQIRTMPAPDFTEPRTANGKGPKGKKGVKGNASPAQSAAVPRPRKMSSPAAVNIRRDSIGVDGRPKREIHAPPPKSLPYQNAPQRRGKNAVQLKFCAAVLKEMTHKKHEAFAFPFYVPVDAKALGLHDYHTVIRNPMDLGTIQSKLSGGEYESADDFEYDIRLMFRNCYKYNGPGQPVNTMGHRLESVFNEKWAEKPIPRSGGYGSDSEEDSGPDDQGKQTVQMLTKQLEAMKNQIASINSQKKKKKPKRERFDDDEGGMGPRDSDMYRPGKKNGRKRRDALDDIDESPMFPSFEQKTALSTKMGYMTEHQMPVVIQILKRTDPNFDPEDEEVELDVDNVHPKTIRLLWNWIMDDIEPSFMRKKAPKPKKNRNVLSENEQQRQIEQLEAQLTKFNGEGGDAYGYDSRYGNIPNDDSSDSDSDASSEEDE